MTVIKAWNSSTSSWEIIAVGAQGPAGDITSSVLNDLSDVVAPTPVDKDFLKYNGTSWVNSSINLSTDTTNTLPIARGGTNGSATPTSGGVNYGTGTAHAFTSAGTTGQVLQSAGSSAPVWATAARGYQTQTSANTTSPLFGATTVYEDVNLSFTNLAVTTSRRYKWTITGHVYATAADSVIQIALRDGSTVKAATNVLVSAANLATQYTLMFYETLSTTPVNRKISIITLAGGSTSYHLADGSRIAYMTLEDVGV